MGRYTDNINVGVVGGKSLIKKRYNGNNLDNAEPSGYKCN